MSISRRQFLKFASVSSILGFGASIGGANLLNAQLNPPHVAPNPEALTAKRWAMVVDMSKFRTDEDFQKTIDACHRVHNVPDFRNPDGSVDTKNEVRWITSVPFENAFPEQEDRFLDERFRKMPFLILCNHCDNPPCVRVCPTKATFRYPDGIVMQDEHRCIGCRFCMAACPYGARSFNWLDPRKAIKPGTENRYYPTRTIGVVEKCTFCTERLQFGKMPACVEAAPEGGMFFGDIEDPDSEVRKLVSARLTLRRKPELGTRPAVYYLMKESNHA